MTHRALLLSGFALLLSACSSDPSSPSQLDFRLDPASGMCMPVPTPEPGKDMPWVSWTPCSDPCAGLDQAQCKADPRCLAHVLGTCPPNADCQAPGIFVACEPNPVPDKCLGLEEKVCSATPGCQPIFGGVPCVCNGGPAEGGNAGNTTCACPAIAVYRGCAEAQVPPPSCQSDAQCGPGLHCSTDDGACGRPPGCDDKSPCPAVCSGVCVSDPIQPPHCFDPNIDKILCALGPPPCPSALVPEVQNGCWTGLCISAEGCHPACEGLDAATCQATPGCEAERICYACASGQEPCPGCLYRGCHVANHGSSCFEIHDEQTCVLRSDCEPVYSGARCFCDPQGCGCLDYSFDSCRPRPTPPPTCDGVPAGDIDGDWTSGTRKFAFKPDGTFVMTDALAPCPIGVYCIWSGILVNKGKWVFQSQGGGAGVVLLEFADPHQGDTFLSFDSTLFVKGCGADERLVDTSGHVFSRSARPL